MPSSGKSTLGRSLAFAINYEYVDMDDIIVHNEKRSIAEIFNESGEAYFRKIESDLLKSFSKKQQKVISTGGGAPCFFDNMDFILKNGISVYLDVKPETLFERIHHSTKNDRPLIDKSDSQKLLQNLTEKYNYRLQYYGKANILIKDNFSIEHILGELEAFWNS